MLALIKQGLMLNLRQKKWVMFHFIFPIFLMLLFGSMSTIDITEENRVESEQSIEMTNVMEVLSEEYGAKIDGYQYYGIVQITMFILYACLFPIGNLGYDERHQMRERIHILGISNFKYFISRILSNSILSIILIVPSILFSIISLNTNWGTNFILTLIGILSLVFMSVTIGTSVGFLAKERGKSALVLQTLVIPLLSFLGGAFIIVPESSNNILSILSNISPLRWINRGIFQNAYLGSCKYLIIGIVINISIISILLILLWYGISRRRKC